MSHIKARKIKLGEYELGLATEHGFSSLVTLHNVGSKRWELGRYCDQGFSIWCNFIRTAHANPPTFKNIESAVTWMEAIRWELEIFGRLLGTVGSESPLTLPKRKQLKTDLPKRRKAR